MDINSIAAFLQINGGWGIAAICMVALWRKDKQFGDKLDERHEEFLALLRETSDMLGSIREVLVRCHNRFDNNNRND